MISGIASWVSSSWWTALIFFVGWVVIGVVAIILLRRKSILGVLPAVLFGLGGHLSVVSQVPPEKLSGWFSLLPVMAALLCIFCLFIGTNGSFLKGNKGE